MQKDCEVIDRCLNEIKALYPNDPQTRRQKVEEAQILFQERFAGKATDLLMKCLFSDDLEYLSIEDEKLSQQVTNFSQCLLKSYYKHKDLSLFSRYYYIEAFMFSQNVSEFTDVTNLDIETKARLERYRRGFGKVNNKPGDFSFEDVKDASELGIRDQVESMFLLSDCLGFITPEEPQKEGPSKIILPNDGTKNNL